MRTLCLQFDSYQHELLLIYFFFTIFSLTLDFVLVSFKFTDWKWCKQLTSPIKCCEKNYSVY